ncbi:hypothetical protein EDD11_006946 [Mortierella claussenii]|nr:hypothetical protein EDD11_006946 [Mortierella claussenii]
MTRKHALSQVLKKTHAKNLDAYRRLLTRQQLTEQSEEHGHQLANTTTAAAIASANFWDIVVVTAGDSQQRLVYEHQIDYKLAQGSIPTFAKYHVVDDPVGSRVGSGGSTFLVMKFLQDKYPQSVLSEARVLLIHAGGYSTRLPHVSARGKVFTTLPQADAPQGIEVLDLKFVLYMHLLKDMPPGVFLTSADGVELFSSKTRFPSQSKPLTITALAHPSSTHIGSTHGVYLLQDSEGLIEQDAKLAPNQQSAMLLKCKRFLHKPSLDVMRTTPSVIHAEDDSGGALSSKLHPESDLEAWADILSFQDPIPSNSTLPVSTLLSPHQQGRQLVREAFQSSGIDLDVMVLNASKFYHLGTMQEFLDAACIDVAFMSELNIRHCGAATQTRDSDGIAYVDASLAQSAQDQLVATAEENGVIHSPVYLENSFVPVTATVHAHSILVDCTLPAGAVIPKNTCMFTLRLQDDEFVTFTFSIKDDMKKEGRVGSNGAAIMEGGSEGASLTTVSEELMVFESVPVSLLERDRTASYWLCGVWTEYGSTWSPKRQSLA